MLACARSVAASALAATFAIAALPASVSAADLYPYEAYGGGEPCERYSQYDDDALYDPPAYGRGGCIPREVARDRLRDAGWRGFHAIEPRGGVVLVKARRPDGRMYDLTIDRCSGEVVDAKPLYGRRAAGYGWGPPPRPEPWGRAYWGPPRY
ncbi:hypothetical protein [Hyphomicrobium sp. D-2]|uniref:hypothetical protein n=1 Tax=Hyphomicrobium sp. D-2 TaxID=3041621 RepID=UPI002458BBB4|nr:hypothetical protein [Hyphomicrobium sp. D-2]MDH4982332.1 hypothetical protein [Hyphomicrobium sp. D-2]